MHYKNGYGFLQKTIKIIAGVFFISLHVLAQDNLKAITNSFNEYRGHILMEKMYAHTDKNSYMSGEIIWFKLYNTDAVFHKLLDISKVAYVEILDTLNKPVLQAKIGLRIGEGEGSFYLPQNIVSGNYRFRAYTNWMKNFGADFFFEKNITIINVQKMQAAILPDTVQEYDVSFFPEGGDFINGFQSKVGFKGTDKNGKGFGFTGYIMDQSDTIVSFKSHHAGMGSFTFTPQSNHAYKAIITTATGTTFMEELPIVYTTGYNMHITEDGKEKINVIVQCNVSSVRELYLLAHTRTVLKFTGTATLQSGKATFVIDRSLLGDGVSQLTVFNVQRKPVSERLYFKRPAQSLSISLNTDKSIYETRKKVDIDIATSNADTARLSMSVYRLDSLQVFGDNTIETYLLLSSDLRGYIENPSYYFTVSETEAAIALDNLMLTQGWRRFKWNNVLQKEKPAFEFVPEFNGHILTGRVINSKTQVPEKYIETFLSVPGSMTQFKTSVSDAKGLIRYELQNFYGGNSIVLQTDTRSDSVSKIEIDDPFSKHHSNRSVPAFNKPVNYPKTLLDQSISMQVQNIYTGDKLKQFSFPLTVDSAAFYITPDLKYTLDDYTRFTSMEEVLREYVAMVNVTRRSGRVYLPVLNTAENLFFQTDPLVLVDAVPIFNLNNFLQFDPLKMKTLDVVACRYILGNSIFEGILNWKTYDPTLTNYEFPSNVSVLDYEGLQIEREFYAPAYNTTEALSSHLPDFRNVLLWKPSIQLNGSNKTTIEFYTSDLPGKYAVAVQGLSQNGICGSKIITFEVKKPAQ